MFNIQLSNFKDVNDFLSMVGNEGLNHYYKNCYNRDHCEMIRSAINFVNQTSFTIHSFNDGNNVFEIIVNIDPDHILQSTYYHTRHKPVTLEEMSKKPEQYKVEILELTSQFTKYYDRRSELHKICDFKLN